MTSYFTISRLKGSGNFRPADERGTRCPSHIIPFRFLGAYGVYAIVLFYSHVAFFKQTGYVRDPQLTFYSLSLHLINLASQQFRFPFLFENDTYCVNVGYSLFSDNKMDMLRSRVLWVHRAR